VLRALPAGGRLEDRADRVGQHARPGDGIVSSRLADERLWAEVLNLGAFDLLLGSPFVAEEVVRVTQCASEAGGGVGDPRSRVQFSSELADERRHAPVLARTANGNA